MFLYFGDILPTAGIGNVSIIGIFAAVIFFLIFTGIAVFAYKMLKRTVKMAFRMVIVAAILLIAGIGSLALFYGVQSTQPRQNRPPPRQTR